MKKRKKWKRENAIWKSIGITLLYLLIFYYWEHPALDLQNGAFYFYIIPAIFIFLLCDSIQSSGIRFENMQTGKIDIRFGNDFKKWLIIPVIFLCLGLIYFVNSPLFNAKKYYERIDIDTTKTFQEEIKEVDFNKIPL